MFLKFIQDFALKKIIKKKLANYKLSEAAASIVTVGVIIDQSYFNREEALINELENAGITWENIQILLFKEKIKPKETPVYPYFTRKNISALGEFDGDALQFINTSFDMLISYYDIEKKPLVLTTLSSKAKFKAGFSSVNKSLNHFTINTVPEKYAEYISELIKYLKILNKI